MLATVKVKTWMASGSSPLAALMVMGKIPDEEAEPARAAVPSWWSVNVTPTGRAPVSLSAGAGTPVAVTVTLNAEPAVTVAVPGW